MEKEEICERATVMKRCNFELHGKEWTGIHVRSGHEEKIPKMQNANVRVRSFEPASNDVKPIAPSPA